MFKGSSLLRLTMSQPQGGQQPAGPDGGQMIMMLFFMLLMTFFIMNPNFRNALSGYADPALSPWLPEEAYFVITVLISFHNILQEYHTIYYFIIMLPPIRISNRYYLTI